MKKKELKARYQQQNTLIASLYEDIFILCGNDEAEKMRIKLTYQIIKDMDKQIHADIDGKINKFISNFK